jgi:hypothetical protein
MNSVEKIPKSQVDNLVKILHSDKDASYDLISSLNKPIRDLLCKDDYLTINSTKKQQKNIKNYFEMKCLDNGFYCFPHDGTVLVIKSLKIDIDDLNKYLNEREPNVIFKFEEICPEFNLDSFENVPFVKQPATRDYYQIMKQNFEIFQIRNPLCWGEKLEDDTVAIRSWDEIQKIFAPLKIDGKPFVKMWLEDSTKKEYRKMDFLPRPMVCPTSTYNLWSDYRVEEVEGGECDTWVNLVNTLEIGKFVIDWFANIIQYPGKRSEVAIIITGVEGCGKNSLLLPIYKILGDDKWFATGDPENHLFGKFSNGLVRKLLVVLEETDPKQTFSNSEKLKTMITEPTIPYEGKGKDTITVKNLANFFGTSNFNRPVKLSKTDRRYVLDEMPDTYVDNTIYWDKYRVWLNNPANIWALYQFLLKRDLTEVNFGRDRPITETFLDIQRSCLPMEIKFLEHLTYNFKKSWLESITGKELFGTYKAFAGKAFENTSDSSFSRSLNKLNVPGIFRLKPNMYGGRWKIDITLVRNWLLEKKYMVVQVYDEPKVEPSVPLDKNICLIEDENFLNPDSSH